MNQIKIRQMSYIALFSALCYIGFTFFKINIPVGGDTTAIHFGNAFCVLAALLLGGIPGGLAGAIGMGIADLMDPLYIASFPKTFILKFCIGMITGWIAYRIAHLEKHQQDTRYLWRWSLLAAAGGMLFNVIFDPLIGFLYKNYILKVSYEAASIFAAWSTLSTAINAITSIVIAVVLYMALHRSIAYTRKDLK